MTLTDLDTKPQTKRYWLSPPELYDPLNAEFHFDFDPCPNPRPEGFDGLTCEWGQSSYFNPPFTGDAKVPGKRKLGPVAWIRKAVAERAKGKLSVGVLPMYSNRAISMAHDFGAEIRYAGKPRWIAIEDGTTNPCSDSDIQPCVLLIFRPVGEAMTDLDNLPYACDQSPDVLISLKELEHLRRIERLAWKALPQLATEGQRTAVGELREELTRKE